MIETDVQVTADGVLVIFHDKTLDSCTTGTGPVAEKTYRDLRRLRLEDGSRIPSFARLLSWLRRTPVSLIAELKLDGWTVGQAATYARTVRRAGMAGRTVASSFDPANLASLRMVDRGIRTALVFSRDVPSIEEISAFGTTSMPWFKNITGDQVAQHHAAGLQVWCWTARSSDQFRRACDLGADGIVADDPESLRHWLGGLRRGGAGPRVGPAPQHSSTSRVRTSYL